jgi:adenine-specific DNA glycosylase
MLHAGAKRVVEEHNGQLPSDLKALLRIGDSGCLRACLPMRASTLS